MKVKAQRVSKKKDHVTWCRLSEGYDSDTSIDIDLDDYLEVDEVEGDLPESDERYPKGAFEAGYVKVGNKILKKKDL